MKKITDAEEIKAKGIEYCKGNINKVGRIISV